MDIKLVLSQLYYHNDLLKNYYKTFGSMYKLYNIKQYGGGFNIDYRNINIKYHKIIEDGRMNLYLSTLDKKDSCIFIIIDQDIAYIQGITSNKYNTCFTQPELNNGKNIMEVSIKMLKKYKSKLKIKYIELTDNSFIQCNETVKIWLANLSFLQYNDTFYGRFGFRPKDKEMYEKYLSNRVILKIKLVNDIDLTDIIRKYNKSITVELKTKLLDSYNKYKEFNIVQWFNKVSRKYMKLDCNFFDYLINTIFQHFRLEKLKGELYRLEL